MPLVSVIIPTRNREGLTVRALESVFAQSFRDFEVMVVDDGSTDNTPAIINALKQDIIFIEQPHSGVSAARNMGIEASSGELAAFLDSDDTWAPGKLAKQVDLYNRVGRPFICHTHETWIRNGRELDQRTYHTKQGGRFFLRALERCLISPSSVVISRDVFEQVGVFDTELTAGEDYDLWLRITAHYEVHYIPDKLVTKYGGHGDQLSVTTPAIDRYRIKSIEKILGDYNLNPQYRMAAIAELERKCSIMATGCKKRGKIKEAEYYLGIPIKYKA